MNFQSVVPLQSGFARHPVRIVVPAESPIGDGSNALDWDNPRMDVEMHAQFIERAPGEGDDASRELPEARANFEIRYRADLERHLSAGSRVLIRGQAWDVERIVNPGFRNISLVLYCRLKPEDSTP